MPERTASIENIQKNLRAQAQQHNKEVVILRALAELDPHNDDWIQGYPETLRRLQHAIQAELDALPQKGDPYGV